jgi:predicted SAM-dependent methyltransferase
LGRHVRTLLKPVTKARRQTLIKRYLAATATRKLQIGSGRNVLPGWLSTDIDPRSARVAYLDATRPFPFADAVFDYVYSEHMIEHIDWSQGLFMLCECRRVLKPGGTLRIATPDLQTLLGLYPCASDPLGARYIEWITDKFLDRTAYKASLVINNAFRNWGHEFLYDGELLTMRMQQAGFSHIRRCAPGESADDHLSGIESHGENVASDEMAAFETMCFEGTRE